MKRFTAGFLVLLGVTGLRSQEPVPFVNPHPLSASHFNPLMEGMHDRTELAYKQASYYEAGYITYNGTTYIRELDFESSELSLFYKKSYNGFSLSLDTGATRYFNGFLDNAIVYIHDHTGSTGGEWKKRKEAPRNRYRFSMTDVYGNEVFSEKREWVYKFNIYLGIKLPYGFYLRGGVKPPIKKGDSLFTSQDYEYAATLQKAGSVGDLTVVADASYIWPAGDNTGLKVKENRIAANLLLAYAGYYIQFNYIESVYDVPDEKILDSFGGVYTFGYRGAQWFWGVTEDYSNYNSPDISLMIGYRF